MAGFFAAHPDIYFPIETLRETIAGVAKRGVELNLKALDTGFWAGKKNLISQTNDKT